MKLAHTTPLMATGDTLEAWAASDSTFDLFFEHAAQPVPAEEMIRLRPAIVSAERRLLWGFQYRPVWNNSPKTEFPALVVGEAQGDRCSAIVTEVRCTLSAENRRGEYRLSELDRIRHVLEGADLVESGWRGITDLLSDKADPWPQIERFRSLSAVLAEPVDQDLIDLRTAEAIPGEWAETAGRFLPLLTDLSYSNRRQALRMVVELLRGGIDGDELVHEVSQLSRQEVLPALRRRRYPALTDLERRLDAVRRRALSGTGVALVPPNNFEGDRFQVSFAFRTGAELRSRLSAAGRLEDNIDELLDLLF